MEEKKPWETPRLAEKLGEESEIWKLIITDILLWRSSLIPLPETFDLCDLHSVDKRYLDKAYFDALCLAAYLRQRIEETEAVRRFRAEDGEHYVHDGRGGGRGRE